MKSRRIVPALVCACLASLSAVPSQASAQQIRRIIVLGDSYSDIGNALRLAGISPISTQIYTTGRFSGGSNYIDTLSNILQVPQYNFAIGGASTTGNGTAGLPGFPFEVQQFINGGGALGFPSVNPALTRNDLVAVSIGGNDSRYYQLGGGTVAGAPAAAAAAVTSFQQNFDLVMQKGTPTISFLAGNAAVLPEVATNPSAQAVRAAFSSAYNTGAQQVLAGYASRGAIVHYLDLTQIATNITANPASYGITGMVCPALPDPTCVANSNAPYVFYVDNLHLTSVGFAIVGKYVARQLAAPLTLQSPSDLGLDVARQWGRTLSSRSDLSGRGNGPGGLSIYALGDALQHDVAATDTNSAFDVKSVGATVGAEFRMAEGTVGIAANYSRPKVNFGNDAARIRAHSWQVGAYGSLSSAGLFGQAYLGYGTDHDRITRTGVVQNMTARPSGSHTVAGAKAGYLLSAGPFGLGPIIALDYARAKVDGYTESGDPALTLNVSRQTLKSLTGQLGAEIRGSLAGLHPFVDLTAERNFTGNNQLITFDETSAPVIVNSWTVARQKGTYGRLSGGASADLFSGLSLDAYVSTTLGRNHGQDVGGNIALKARF